MIGTFRISMSYVGMYCVLGGGCLYPTRGRVHLRVSEIRVSERNGKLVLVVSKFTWELFWVIYL
jgi:hypothetical protein